MRVLALLMTGCSITVEPKGDRRGDDDDTTDVNECSDHSDCPDGRPVCCDMGTYNGCFQWGIEIEGGEYLCVNDQCERDADCPDRRPICCNFEAAVGVPYTECVEEDFSFTTTGGLSWACQ